MLDATQETTHADDQGAGRLRFGLFELDLATLDLSKSGRPVRLQPQPAKVLAYLAARPGTLVARETLRTHIWGDTFVDAEAGLNACIRDVRAALGDRASAPTYVETAPRRGYRFIAPVERVTCDETPQRPPTPPEFLGRRGRSATYPALYAAAAVLALALGAFGLHAAITRDDTETEVPAAETLVVQVVPSVGATPPRVDPAAHEAWLEARYLLDRGQRGDAVQAVAKAERALALEPDWGAAWLILGDAHLSRAAPPHDAMPAARDAYSQALAQPDLSATDRADAHQGLAMVHLSYDWDLPAAREELVLAERFGGPTSTRHQAWAFFFLTNRQPRRALDHLHEALRLDPVSARIRGDIGWIYALVGELDRAVEECAKGVELEPDAAWLHGCLVDAHRAAGRLDLAADAARAEIAAKLRKDPGAAAPADLEGASPETALAALDRWRLERLQAARAERWVPSCAVGIRHAQAGEPDLAFALLDQAFDERSGFMPLLEMSLALAPLRDDPRFRRLADRVRGASRGLDVPPTSASGVAAAHLSARPEIQ